MSSQLICENHIQVNRDHFCDDQKVSSVKSIQNRSKDRFQKIITREEAKYLAQRIISTDAELVDYYLRSYSEEKIGFLGSHQSLVLVAKRSNSDENEKHSFFVKTIPYDIPSQVAYIEEKGAFRKEVVFFKSVVPLLIENYKGVPWTPKCYLAKEDTLVFDDMKYKGFSNRPRILDEVMVKSAIACIARFHASSLLAEEKLNGKSLKEVYPDAFEESEYKATERSYAWFVTAINLAISVAKDLGLDTSTIRTTSERVFDVAKPSKNKRNVICHGDLWSSNLLFDETNNCCNLVDFQLIRYGPLAQDVIQLLYLTTTREFREKHEQQIVEHYYKTFNDTLVANDYEGIVPSYEEVLQGIEEQRYLALVNAAINYPTIMMDGKIGAKIMNGLDAYEAYFFRDRKPFVDKIMSLDPDYERRINNIMTELTEMSPKVINLPRPT